MLSPSHSLSETNTRTILLYSQCLYRTGRYYSNPSDLLESTLVRRLYSIIFPELYDNVQITDVVKKSRYAFIQQEIIKVSKRINYAFDSSMHCWRWEVNDITLFPPNIQQLILLRREQRMEMQTNLYAKLSELTEEEQSRIQTIRKRLPEIEENVIKQKKPKAIKKEKVATPKKPSNQATISDFFKVAKKLDVDSFESVFDTLFKPFFINNNTGR